MRRAFTVAQTVFAHALGTLTAALAAVLGIVLHVGAAGAAADLAGAAGQAGRAALARAVDARLAALTRDAAAAAVVDVGLGVDAQLATFAGAGQTLGARGWRYLSHTFNFKL